MKEILGGYTDCNLLRHLKIYVDRADQRQCFVAQLQNVNQGSVRAFLFILFTEDTVQ